MTDLIRVGLRWSASEPEGDEPEPGGLWYRVEKEIIPLLRKVLEAVNIIGPGFGVTVNITTADSPYTVADNVEFVRADAFTGPVQLLIPAAADYRIRFLSVKKTDSSSNVVNVVAQTGEDLDGGVGAPVTIGQTFLRFIPREGGYDIA